jgi:hypothetical protein
MSEAWTTLECTKNDRHGTTGMGGRTMTARLGLSGPETAPCDKVVG